MMITASTAVHPLPASSPHSPSELDLTPLLGADGMTMAVVVLIAVGVGAGVAVAHAAVVRYRNGDR